MHLELLPLLHKQRELYAMPRSMERFHAYLKEMKGDSADDVEFAPLVLMNPMGKEHCLAAEIASSLLARKMRPRRR